MSGVCSGVWSWCQVSIFVLFSFDVINRSKFASYYNAGFNCDCEPACDWYVGSNGVHGWASHVGGHLILEDHQFLKTSDFGRR